MEEPNRFFCTGNSLMCVAFARQLLYVFEAFTKEGYQIAPPRTLERQKGLTLPLTNRLYMASCDVYILRMLGKAEDRLGGHRVALF